MPLDTESWSRDAKDVILRWTREGREPTPAMHAMLEACNDIEQLRETAQIMQEGIIAAMCSESSAAGIKRQLANTLERALAAQR